MFVLAIIGLFILQCGSINPNDETKEAIACNGEEVFQTPIECPSEAIKVTSAVYGSDWCNDTCCPDNTFCESPIFFWDTNYGRHIEEFCDGKEHCNLHTEKREFFFNCGGDYWPFVDYMKVEYVCVERPTTTAAPEVITTADTDDTTDDTTSNVTDIQNNGFDKVKHDDKKQNLGVLVGVPIGVCVACVLIAVLVVFLVKRRREKSLLDPENVSGHTESEVSAKDGYNPEGFKSARYSSAGDLTTLSRENQSEEDAAANRTPSSLLSEHFSPNHHDNTRRDEVDKEDTYASITNAAIQNVHM